MSPGVAKEFEAALPAFFDLHPTLCNRLLLLLAQGTTLPLVLRLIEHLLTPFPDELNMLFDSLKFSILFFEFPGEHCAFKVCENSRIEQAILAIKCLLGALFAFLIDYGLINSRIKILLVLNALLRETLAWRSELFEFYIRIRKEHLVDIVTLWLDALLTRGQDRFVRFQPILAIDHLLSIATTFVLFVTHQSIKVLESNIFSLFIFMRNFVEVSVDSSFNT